MIELLVAYLLYEGGAGIEWWALFAALFAFKVNHIYKNMKREQEEELLIKKIINAEVVSKDISSNH
jgi:predicted RNA methylase